MLAAMSYSAEFYTYNLPWQVAVMVGAGMLLALAAGAGVLVWVLKRKPKRRSVP